MAEDCPTTKMSTYYQYIHGKTTNYVPVDEISDVLTMELHAVVHAVNLVLSVDSSFVDIVSIVRVADIVAKINFV